MEAFGLAPGDFETGYALWPCVAPALRVLDAMGTQWRVGGGGAIGLDYAVLPQVMQWLGIGRRSRAVLFEDLRHMEQEALKVINDDGRRT
ncbi:DUF1799 domain-containing protein [Pseudomonas sp. PDM20]|uniref:DUF1799 domain-containing protein n=1 Tax=Pseudomonas sp. PDM20 TaxID=2769254 RepID=UPI00177DDA98|nr:DUF1799 domain-containing protein [Pseudomonas sp. PDM20]